MNISHSPAGSLPNKTRGKTTENGANPQPNPQKQPTTPPKFDPKQAAKMDHVRRSGLTITPTEIQPKLVLTDILVTPGHGVSQQDLKDNSFLRKCAAILDRKETLDTNQQKRLAEITQRRTPPTVETPQPEQEAVGYADILYSSVQSGFGWVSSLASYRPSMAGVSMALTVASSVADQFPATRPLSQGMSLVAGAVTLANGAIGLSQEATNYIEGKKVNLWNVGSSAAQTLSGTGMLTGGSAVRTASVFASTGLHAAKAFQTQSFENAGAAIVGALSLAVGGDSVALANTVLAYSNLIQGGVSVWRKLEADAAQKAEAAALQQLVTILEKPVTTEAEADAVTAKAVAFLKSTGVGTLPQTSALGKLFHSFRNLPETATHTLGLLLSPLCSLGKPSSSNLGTYLVGSLLGLSLLPGANAQSVNQQLGELRLIAANLNATSIEQAKQMVELKEVQVRADQELQEVTSLAGNQTVALEKTNQQLQEVTYLAGNLTAELALQKQLTGNLTVALEKSNEAIAASNEAIAANKADNQYTRDVAFRLAGVGVAAIGIAIIAYTIKHCFFKTVPTVPQDTRATRIQNALIKDTLIERNDARIATARATLGTLQNRWDVRNELHTRVTHTFINRAAVAPAEPESLGELDYDLKELRRISPMTSADMTSAELVLLADILERLPERNEAAALATTRLIEAIDPESVAARASIGRNSTSLQSAQLYTALTDHSLVSSFRGLNDRFGLGVSQNLANTVIALVLNPGDIGRDDAPEALTVAHVTAMATALNANVRVLTAIEGEIAAIKDAARRVFAPTTGLLVSLSPALRAPIQEQIDAFNDAVALTNAPRSQTPANFDTALTSRHELRRAWSEATNDACQKVLEHRRALDPLMSSLTEFRALGLGLDQTAAETLANLNTHIPDNVTPATFGNLQEVDFRNLATALEVVQTVPGAIAAEIGAIVQHVRDSVAAQERFNLTGNIQGLGLRSLEGFTRTSAALADFEAGAPNPATCGDAIDARTALRRDIIAYVNGSRDAIRQSLDATAADITALEALQGFTGTVNVPFDGTATQDSLHLLQFAITQTAEVTEDTLNRMTADQFEALAAARPVLDTFAGTIAGETREIQAGLVAKLGDGRQRIAALPQRISALLAAELGTFERESATITDQADTQTLANFETVFAAIRAVDTAAAAAAAAARETAAVKIQGVGRQRLASRQTLLLYRTAVQAKLQAQQGINASLREGPIRNSIDPTLFQTFAETSAIALQAGATREQLDDADTARQALRDAITLTADEGLANMTEVQRSLAASPSSRPRPKAAAPFTPSLGSDSAQELNRNPDEFVIDIRPAAAAEEKGGAPQDGDIEEGRGGGRDS